MTQRKTQPKEKAHNDNKYMGIMPTWANKPT